jgi:hypothetical protein
VLPSPLRRRVDLGDGGLGKAGGQAAEGRHARQQKGEEKVPVDEHEEEDDAKDGRPAAGGSREELAGTELDLRLLTVGSEAAIVIVCQRWCDSLLLLLLLLLLRGSLASRRWSYHSA